MREKNGFPVHVVVGSMGAKTSPLLYCPICGKQVFALGDERGKIDPCPHLAFLLLDDTDCYESDDYRQREQNLLMDQREPAGFDDYLAALGYDGSLLVLETTGIGYVESPVTVAVMAGFEFGAVA
jgi:hypothetical protein